MTKEIISDSNILESIFGKKHSHFLKSTDQKSDALEMMLEEQKKLKNNLIEKIVENEREEKMKREEQKCRDDIIEDIYQLMFMMKELNHAIIRLIVNRETGSKYKSQEMMQTEICIKDKIDEFLQREKELNKKIGKVAKYATHSSKYVQPFVEEIEEVYDLDETEHPSFHSRDEQVSLEKQIIEKETTRRKRSGSALASIKAIIEQEENNEANTVLNNDTLLISEKEAKVFLPYTVDELNQYLYAYPNEYQGYEDLIDKEFVLPLEGFLKNQSISRFKEAYHLIRNKEVRSMIEAMKFSSQMMFRYELNPAIIAACKSKKELNQYMNCLEEKTMDNFDCFKIKFDLNLL